MHGDVQLINKREIKQFLGLDLLFLKRLLALFFIAVNSERIRRCNHSQKINFVFVVFALR